MKWILIFVMFNNGVHYSQSLPLLYDNYDTCKIAAEDVKQRLEGTKPNDAAYALSFCVALPEGA